MRKHIVNNVKSSLCHNAPFKRFFRLLTKHISNHRIAKDLLTFI